MKLHHSKTLGESLSPPEQFKVYSKHRALNPRQPVYLRVFNFMNINANCHGCKHSLPSGVFNLGCAFYFFKVLSLY